MALESPTQIALIGASGRMGRAILDNLSRFSNLEIGAAVVMSGSEEQGRALHVGGPLATSNLEVAIADCAVVIDFSSPESCLAAARVAAEHAKPFVSGTTGLSVQQQDELRALSQETAILHAANFSVGVNVLERLVELASRAVGEEFDIEVFEAHHRRKVDAPSGTALLLGHAAARGRDVVLDDVARWDRHGQVGARTNSEIGFQVLRGGDVVGEHTVFLCADGERLELTHRATDRGIFARGALRAAGWMVDKESGWFAMSDVLFGQV
ncbi:MAG: 4-hydroxy-tetrahydrodipicolinate reductase [Bradymonadaceae bacterium]|nr:4-hydroxy-tetrahydrodipicolinate reductase [Lujinxingiaceae bacterium]